jgi:hypothetical protein
MEEKDFETTTVSNRQDQIIEITKQIESIMNNKLTPIEAYGVLEFIKLRVYTNVNIVSKMMDLQEIFGKLKES